MAPLASLIILLLSPASAEVCYFNPGTPGARNPVATMHELGGPACLASGRFVFQRRYNMSRYSENEETFIDDISADRCPAVVAGAKASVDGPGALILGQTMISKQVWIWKSGGCSSFFSKVTALNTKDSKYEDIFKQVGAERLSATFSSDVSVMLDQLEEAGRKRLDKKKQP